MSILLNGSKQRSAKEIQMAEKRGAQLRDLMYKYKLKVRDIADILKLSNASVYAFLSGRVYMANVYWSSLKDHVKEIKDEKNT
jgi:hypothetical protein